MENAPSREVLQTAVFVLLLVAMATWEYVAPRRPRAPGRLYRWAINLGLALACTGLLRIALPFAPVGAARIAEASDFGLLRWLDVPEPLAFALALVAMDFAIWAQHVAMHRVPAFWRLHRIHHADIDIDVTTGVRFHPFEALVSMLWKMAVAALLGAGPVAVAAYEAMLLALALFNHANIAWPSAVEARLRLVLVTPDMHRIHHSTHRAETDSNYGNTLSIWDRIFGTYIEEPVGGQLGLRIGLDELREPQELKFWSLLMRPLRGD
jgi:sterol desaturase/sphingolipid hydroxylase (fatty acid hydroxylase superfamily)